MRGMFPAVKVIERGGDATSVITKRSTLADNRQAVQDKADRTIITDVIEFAQSRVSQDHARGQTSPIADSFGRRVFRTGC